MYDPAFIQPMRDEMTQAGFEEVRTADDVDGALADTNKSTLIFVNSVCGCAAGIARPAVVESLKNEIRPANLVTAFAGNDAEAVNRARELFLPYPPSSPCAGLFRDGKLVHMIERHQIEGQTAGALAKIFTSVYDRYCGETIDESVGVHDPLADLEVSVEEVREKISVNADLALLDVREAWEAEKGKIEGSQLADNALGQEIVKSWPREREIVVYCEHGSRSMQAVQFLRQHGFENTRSLSGGFAAWAANAS
jgi:putative YphP/YqiW family bacilliredoxin